MEAHFLSVISNLVTSYCIILTSCRLVNICTLERFKNENLSG